MITPFHATEGMMQALFDEIFQRAVEGDNYHTGMEVAQADVSVTLATAGTPVTAGVTFAKPFESAPTVMLTLVSAANVATYINVLATSVTVTGFTLQAASGAAQTIKLRWLAYGRRM